MFPGSHPVYRLVEAVRALRTYRIVSDKGSTVRLACGEEFPRRIADVHDALEAMDTSAALTALDDVDKMKKGLDAAVKWVSVRGMDVKDFEASILAAIAEKPKTPRGLKLLPSFSTGRQRRRFRPEGNRRVERSRTIRKVGDLLNAGTDIQLMGETLSSVLPPAQDYTERATPTR